MDWTRRQKGAEDVNRGAQAYKVITPTRHPPVCRLRQLSMAVLFHQAWLGYYNGLQRKCGWSPTELVATANRFSACALLPSPIRSAQRLSYSLAFLYNCRGVPTSPIRSVERLSYSLAFIYNCRAVLIAGARKGRT